MTKNVKQLIAAALKDEMLLEKMKTLDCQEAVITFAAERGITLTAEDFVSAEETLSDDDLEAVSGEIDAIPQNMYGNSLFANAASNEALLKRMEEVAAMQGLTGEKNPELQFAMNQYNATLEMISSVTKDIQDMLKSLAQRV